MTPDMARLIRKVRWARKAVRREHGPIRFVRIRRHESGFGYLVSFYLKASDWVVDVTL